MAEKDFDAFKQTIEERFMGHPVVTANAYTKWFSHGEMPIDHLRRFAVEFSVFSNQFLLAALNRVINADTLHAARESKEILMNELGVIYNKGGNEAGAPGSDVDREGDPRSSQPKVRSTAGSSAFRPPCRWHSSRGTTRLRTSTKRTSGTSCVNVMRRRSFARSHF